MVSPYVAIAGLHDLAVLVLEDLRLGHTRRSAVDGHPVGLLGVGDAQSDVVDAVAVKPDVIGDRAIVVERAREDKAHLVLLHDSKRRDPGFRSRGPSRRPE